LFCALPPKAPAAHPANKLIENAASVE